MPRARKDDAIVAYVKAHQKIGDRSADTVAARLEMSETDLRTLVHHSGRVWMRAVLLGWHVVELAPQEKYDENAPETRDLTPVPEEA